MRALVFCILSIVVGPKPLLVSISLHVMSLVVVKVPLILVAAAGAWYALTPPQPPPRTQERVKSGGVERSFGSVVRIHALVWKVCCTKPLVYIVN